MSSVWKPSSGGNSLLCAVAAIVVSTAMVNSASAIHRRGRIAYGTVAGADVVAYDRSSCGLAPGIAGNPVGFGFGGYNNGGYPLYGYAQYLPAAYDGYGGVGYAQTMPVGLPGGYGSGVGVTMNLGAATAETCLTGFTPAAVAADCTAGLSPRAYRHYARQMCSAMSRLTWVYLAVPMPILGCYGDYFGGEPGEEMIEGESVNPEALPIEEVQPQSAADEPSPAPETLSAPAMSEDGPSLRYLLERDL